MWPAHREKVVKKRAYTLRLNSRIERDAEYGADDTLTVSGYDVPSLDLHRSHFNKVLLSGLDGSATVDAVSTLLQPFCMLDRDVRHSMEFVSQPASGGKCGRVSGYIPDYLVHPIQLHLSFMTKLKPCKMGKSHYNRTIFETKNVDTGFQTF